MAWFSSSSDKPQQSGQQRRAKANRAADRAGQAAIGKLRTSQSTTNWHTAPAPRSWWRSS